MAANLKPFVLCTYGSSLTTGRLSADWVPRLQDRLRMEPEAKGQVIILNRGKGSQTSDWGLANAQSVADLKPTHILFEGFAINDCALGVSLGTASSNFQFMVETFQTIPGVVLTHQTMSPAWTGDTNRTNLQTYYNQELAKAASLGITSLNHTPGWPALTADNTNNGDFLHPIWTGVFETYSFPAILTRAKALMAAYWP